MPSTSGASLLPAINLVFSLPGSAQVPRSPQVFLIRAPGFPLLLTQGSTSQYLFTNSSVSLDVGVFFGVDFLKCFGSSVVRIKTVLFKQLYEASRRLWLVPRPLSMWVPPIGLLYPARLQALRAGLYLLLGSPADTGAALALTRCLLPEVCEFLGKRIFSEGWGATIISRSS